MLPHPFPPLPMIFISPFTLGVVGLFVFTLCTSLLWILFHYIPRPTTPTAPTQPPPKVIPNFDSVPMTSEVTMDSPYLGMITVGRKQNEASHKYMLRGMLAVIDENVGPSDKPEDETLGLSVDLTASDHVNMDNAHSFLDTILRDWLKSHSSRLEQLEIFLPPHFKRDNTRTEPLAPPLPMLTQFTWGGNATDMPLPFLHLSNLPLEQLTYINLQTAMSVTDAILILSNCSVIEHAEFHGLSDVPSVLKLDMCLLRVLRHLDTLQVSSYVSLRPLFEAFEMRFLQKLSLTIAAADAETLDFSRSFAWDAIQVIELHGNFCSDTIQRMIDSTSRTEVDFKHSRSTHSLSNNFM